MNRNFLPAIFLLILAAFTPALAQFADADMEAPDREAWSTYGTPVTVEKTAQAHSGNQALRVVTDNKDTMGGNYEGTSHTFGDVNQGDTIRVSFWYRATDARGLVIGMGRTQMTGRWEIGGSGWQPVALEYKVRQSGSHNIWLSQAGEATEFFLDDFTVTITPRPQVTALAEPPEPVQTFGDFSFGSRTGLLYLKTPTGQLLPSPWLSLDLLGKDGISYEPVPFERLKLAQMSKTDRAGHDGYCVFQVQGEPIEVRVAITRSSDDHLSFHAVVTNRSQRTVLNLTLPDLYGVTPDGARENWTLVNPWVCGQILRDPLKSDGLDTGYPGRGVMGWMDLAGATRGLYLGVHDGSGQGVRLQAIPAPDSRMDLSTSFEICVRPGGSWTSPPVVLASHPGDWHKGADIYRQLSAEDPQKTDGVRQVAFRKPDVPQWMYDSNGWTLVGMQNDIPFRYLSDIYRASAWMGLEYLHVQGQQIDHAWWDEQGNRHGRDVTFPYPSPRLGGPEELKKQIAEIHADGGHVMFYILPDRYTPGHSTGEDFGTGKRSDIPKDVRIPDQKWFLDNAHVQFPGASAPEGNARWEVRLMCPASKQWREWLRWWAVDYYAKKLGADGMYWDVTGRTGPFRCFNERHDHRGENDWAKGCADLMKTVIADGRKVNPDYSAAIEGCSDVLGQWVGYHLLSGATEDQRVFRYTFPGYLCVDGFANHYRPWTMPQKAHRVFLEGEKFDVFGYHQYVRRVINLRRRIKPFIDWPAVYRDDVGLKISDPKIQARRFDRTDNGNKAITVTILNEDHLEGATIEVPGINPRTINLFHLDGRIEPVVLPRAANVAVIPIPADDIAAAVIVENTAPSLQVVPFVEQLYTPGDNGLLLTLFLPLGQPVETAIDGHWPEGFSADGDQLDLTNPSVRQMKFVDEEDLSHLQRWSKTTLDVTWRGGKAQPWTMLAPWLVNGNFEQLEGKYLDYWNVEPDTTNPGEGKYSLAVNAQNTPHGHVTVLTPLKPNCRYRFSAMIRRETADTAASAHVVEYTNETEFVRSAVLSPTKSGEWERLTTDFTTHENPRSTAIYLYNFSKTTNAWFDDLKLEELK